MCRSSAIAFEGRLDGGLYTALMEAPTDQLVVMACDMPFLTAPFPTRLAALSAAGALLLNVNTPDDYARATA